MHAWPGALRRLLRRTERVRVRVRAPRTLVGPLPRGAVVGSATIRAGTRPLGRVRLVTRAAVPAGSGLAQAVRTLGPPGMVVIVVALLAGTTTLLVRRRRPTPA